MPAQPAGLQSIRVLVADSTRMGTQLLSEAVERDRRCKVVDSVVTSTDALRAVGRQHTDVALVGTNLDQTPFRGFDAVRELRSFFPALKSIMLIDASRNEFVVSAFRAGARGVLCRDESLNNLAKCIHSVHLGQIWANSQQLRYALDALANGAVSPIVEASRFTLLSKREQDVVRCVSEGYSNREVAERLKLSEHTVKNYLFRIFDKLGLSSRVEVVLYAVSQREAMEVPSHLGPDDTRISFEAPTVEWTTKAAEQGLGAAQYLLAEMYRTGNGVPRDLAHAYAWFALAEENCAALSERSRAIRTQLALKLTAEQISQARGQTRSRHPQAAKRAPRCAAPEGDARSA